MTDQPVSPTPTFPPDRKILAGGLASVLAWFVLFGAGKVGIAVDPVLQSILVPLIGYAISYLVPPSLRDVVSRVNNDIVKLANADPSNPTTAQVVTPALSRVVAAADVASGAVPAVVVTEKTP